MKGNVIEVKGNLCTVCIKVLSFSAELDSLIFVPFHDFYALKENVKQNSFLMGQYDDAKDSRRQATICFSLPDGRGDVVRRNTFMHVLGISKRRIETYVKAIKNGEVVYNEKRSNRAQNSKFSAADVDLIIEHVNFLLNNESHYGRRKSNKEYLS